jgi:SNF2 family DNA or RNA helicase
MGLELVVSPAGRLSLAEPAPSNDGTPDFVPAAAGFSARVLKEISGAFARDPTEGLFALAVADPRVGAAGPFAYWRDFARRYLELLCQIPETQRGDIEPIPVPDRAELSRLVLSVPPMRGAEYVRPEMLEAVWQRLDEWVRGEVASSREGLPGFLAAHAPLWHQVGRVCFHLAENKRDRDFPFAFLATYSHRISDDNKLQYQPLSRALQEYAGAKNKPGLIKLLSPIHQAAKQSELIRQLVESGEIYHPLAWTPPEAYRFLREVPLFKESGLLVRLPDWWKKRPRPRAGISIGEKSRGKFDADTMLSFRTRIKVGDEELTEREWRDLLATEDGLMLLKGQWVEVDRARLTEALEHWRKLEAGHGEGLSFIEGMRLLAGASADLQEAGDESEAEREWSFVQAGDWLNETLTRLRAPETLDGMTVPKTLQATLRPYQEIGFRWLSFLAELGLGACLADDMGLGKTVQILALLLAQHGKGTNKPSLLVLPASLLANWKSELERFAPSLRAKFVHPSEATREELETLAASPATAFRKTDVVLTTYGMLCRQDWLTAFDWRFAILDESQAIKNPGTRQSKAVKKLRADARIALTGTPVENRLSDLWSLFDFLSPGLLGSRKRFQSFVKTLQSRTKDPYAPLRALVQPYILRRLKTDKSIIADLPDKTEVRAYCGLSKRQAVLYRKLVEELSAALEQNEHSEGIKRRGLVLSYLMRFKQLCNHPSQMLGDGGYDPSDGGKFARLRGICEEIASRQEKVLVFTQFREITAPLLRFLKDVFGRDGLTLHGGTAVKKRKQLVDEFQAEDGPPFFVLSLKAGGTGLNLTAASQVIHFDRWWNPAVENQATDRAFRIGQNRNVLVHKFVCRGTIEEKIDELIEEKSSLASDVLEGGTEKLLTEMSNEELIRMVSLDVERAATGDNFE